MFRNIVSEVILKKFKIEERKTNQTSCNLGGVHKSHEWYLRILLYVAIFKITSPPHTTSRVFLVAGKILDYFSLGPYETLNMSISKFI